MTVLFWALGITAAVNAAYAGWWLLRKPDIPNSAPED